MKQDFITTGRFSARRPDTWEPGVMLGLVVAAIALCLLDLISLLSVLVEMVVP